MQSVIATAIVDFGYASNSTVEEGFSRSRKGSVLKGISNCINDF